MAKLSRTALKLIVKECLVEILQEGLLSDIEAVHPMESQDRAPKRKKPVPSRPALDQVKFEAAISQTVSGLTSDPVMASIFADTAKTTLQEQYSADGAPAARGAPDNPMFSPSPENDPTEIFEKAAANWAALAFAEKKLGNDA
jgi:hypothetical protein